MEALARHFWGEPNPRHSTRHELRFGTNGSVSLDLKKGEWYDHEAKEGGGYAALYRKVYGRPPPNGADTDTVYDYCDASGKLLFQVIRGRPKTFRQRRPDGAGGWIWKLDGVERVLYRLPELIAADPAQPVFIPEGEKDVDALRSRGLIATCNPGGAGKWLDTFSPYLRGRYVVILPDNDETGRDHAADVARRLRPHAASVRVLPLPNLPAKGDVSDWFAAGGTAELLLDLLTEAEDEPACQAPGAPLWTDDDGWTEAELPRRPWIVPGYALRGSVTLLCGPPSALKSSLVLGWAVAVALKRKWGNFNPTEAGSVIVYNVEDNALEQRRRLSAVLRQFDATSADIRGKVIRVGPISMGALLDRDESGALVFTPAMQKLDELIAVRRPAMLIVDPLSELHTSDENDNTALRAVLAAFRELAVRHDIAVIILHHSRKGTVTPGDPDAARGASAIIGAARVAMTLTGMAEDDARTFGLPTDHAARSHFVRLDDAKSNYAPLREAQWFEKAGILLDNGEICAAAMPWTPPSAKVASLMDLSALAAAIERGSPTGEPWAPKLWADPRSIRTLLVEHGFHGIEAQRATLAKLESECGVTTAQYRRPSRHLAIGLRVEGKPAAEWTDH
jgi:AAA domain-containing protein